MIRWRWTLLAVAAAALGLNACRSHKPPPEAARPEPMPLPTPPVILPPQPRPAGPELRGVWISDPRGMNWRQVMSDLRNAGFNSAFVNFSSAGAAFYPSRLLPNVAGRDEMRLCLEAAHAQGIQLHAKFIVWFAFETTPSYQKRLARDGRLLRRPDGQVILQNDWPWLNPSSRVNRDARLAQIREALQSYPVDGVQLDYVRFHETAGRITAARLAANTQFVADVRAVVRQTRPGIPLSISNFYDYNRARNEMGQDWVLWAQQGYVDFLCPMDYTKDITALERWIQAQQRLINGRIPIYPGVAAYMLASPAQINDQVALVRRMNNRGFVLFAYNDRFRQQMLPGLRF